MHFKQCLLLILILLSNNTIGQTNNIENSIINFIRGSDKNSKFLFLRDTLLFKGIPERPMHKTRIITHKEKTIYKRFYVEIVNKENINSDTANIIILTFHISSSILFKPGCYYNEGDIPIQMFYRKNKDIPYLILCSKVLYPQIIYRE